MSPDQPREPAIPGARPASMWQRYARFLGPKVAQDFDEELRFHVEMRIQEYVARGMSLDEARAATLARLGDVGGVREQCVTIGQRRVQRMNRARIVDAFVQDVRFALRAMARQKGWTSVAILTLALGIGANTAVFSVVNTLLLHPLPYPHSDRMAIVFQQPSMGSGSPSGVMVTMTPAPPVVKVWREGSRSFEDLEPFTTPSLTLRAAGSLPQVLNGASVLPTFARFAGHAPLVGRLFNDEEIAAGGRVVLLGEGFWRSRFAGDTSVLGKTLSLDDSLYTVIGVMPADLRLPRHDLASPEIWLPLDLNDKKLGLSLIGRLRPGITTIAATRELDSLTARANVGPPGAASFKTKLMLPREMVGWRQSLLLLSVAVALVLVIACANVAHLLLARAATRQRELAIRRALGAGRGRVFRQMLTESLLLAGVACIGGIVVGWLGLRVLVGMRPESLSELGDARLDATVLLATIAVSLATGLVFGLVGALQASHEATHEALRAGSLGSSGTRRQFRARATLIVSEMALSAALLVGASLLVRSVIHLQTLDPGFQPAGLYAVQFTLPEAKYPSGDARMAFFGEFERRASMLPGVRGATIADGAPPGMTFNIGALQVEGEPDPPKGTTSFLEFSSVEPHYFRLLGLRFAEGSTFTDTTDAGGQAIVNAGLAQKYWPGQSALGRRMRIVGIDGKGLWKRIVGVTANASTRGLTRETSAPMIYYPAQDHFAPTLIVRVAEGPNPMPSLRSLFNTMDPHLAPPTITSVEEDMRASISGAKFTMALLSVFTVLAVVLAAVGLYGTMAYAVAQRTREIGIRIALGASTSRIARGVLANGVGLAAVGLVLGLSGAVWATRLIQRMLYGVEPSDPVAYLASGVVLLAVAALACVVPTRRATSVDAMVAMRAD